MPCAHLAGTLEVLARLRITAQGTLRLADVGSWQYQDDHHNVLEGLLLSTNNPVAVAVHVEEVVVLCVPPELGEDGVAVAGHLVILDVDDDLVISGHHPDTILIVNTFKLLGAVMLY